MKHQKANFLWMKPKYFSGKEFCKIVQTAFQPQNSCPSKRNLEETSAVEKGDEQVCLAAHSAEAGLFLRLPQFQYPGRLWRQDVVFWLFLRSKEPKIIAKALLLVFSWQYGDILFGLERDWCESFSGRRKSPKQGGGPLPFSHPSSCHVLMHEQPGFYSCKGLSKVSNCRTEFLLCGRKIPKNCMLVKQVSGILKISPLPGQWPG